MSGQTKTLFENEWIAVHLRDEWYNYAHMVRGDGVGILIFDSETKKILFRKEHNPAHGEGVRPTSFTGTIENGLTPEQTAVLETREESGYTIEESELLPLGWVYPFKFSDYKQYLFAVNVAGKTPGEIKGDGSIGEKSASTYWGDEDEAVRINEPLISAMLLRLNVKLDLL